MESSARRTWARRVERWRKSGLTAAEFAGDLGIKPSTLAWWKWRLAATRSKAGASRGPRGKSTRARQATVSPLTFVEVTATERLTSLEVVLTGGFRVRVPGDFDAAALERLLDVLERRG